MFGPGNELQFDNFKMLHSDAKSKIFTITTYSAFH